MIPHRVLLLALGFALTLPAAEKPSDEVIAKMKEVQTLYQDKHYSEVLIKLDEIEARVDAKLDGIERRIDQKILGLHEQLRALRDQELRHRLRLLKLTLLFSVLVAVLSLGYKWIVQQWLN